MSQKFHATAARPGADILGNFIDALSMSEATGKISAWARDSESRYVCLCNVHSTITARESTELKAALAASDMVLPDGAPVAWRLRRKGFRTQRRIAGPDLMHELCRQHDGSGQEVFLFGSTPETLATLEDKLRREFPGLNIVGSLSPRFGDWDEAERRQYIDEINSAGEAGKLVFVGLGCPKQEIWMHESSDQVQGVLLGVGAAFDFHAGIITRAPAIYQKLGLEWLHRLMSEPRRLWKRYLVTNSRYLLLTLSDMISG